MKTLKFVMLGTALLFAFVVTNAAAKTTHASPTKEEVINTYLNAVVHGKLDGIENAIDNDAQFNMMRGSNVKTLTKPQIISSLKSSENVEQDCQCTKSVVQDSDDATVLKVEMKYNDFTRTDVITAERAGNGWKITKVDTSFK